MIKRESPVDIYAIGIQCWQEQAAVNMNSSNVLSTGNIEANRKENQEDNAAEQTAIQHFDGSRA